MQNAECRMQNVECRMQSAECREWQVLSKGCNAAVVYFGGSHRISGIRFTPSLPD